MKQIERVARVLWQNDQEAAPLTPAMAIPNSRNWQDYIPRARSVIEAMLEPSEGQSRAGADKVRGIMPTSKEQAASIWQAMIDAALKEE